jgi:ABC-type phosphate transport system substrate-binding protein
VPNYLRRHRRAALIGGIAVLAGSLASISLTGITAASASNLPPGNSIVIASGSQTAYALVADLSNLFNTSQGCIEIASGSETQSLSFNCAGATDGAGNAVGLPANQGENPLNDVITQEPPLGGTNGLKQLEGQVPVLCEPSATTCTASQSINFATTVRDPLPTDPTGLNFVNYADDAISWFHFTEVAGKKTPSAKITNLTLADLANIWSGTYTNWDQIPGVTGKNAAICVYVTNTGSGLYSLWQTYLGLGALNSYVNSLTAAPAGCDTPNGVSYATSHTIEQNEDASMIANGDEANAIFFFSNGRFTQTCAIFCGGTKPPGTTKALPSTAVLSEINGVPLTSANILSGAWPAIVFLSNVYSDGSNSAIPAATQATLNFASEQGFLCKSQLDSGSNEILDPITGVWYRTEIQTLITGEGFVPLPSGSEGTVQNPAVLTAPYNGYDSSGVDPTGYCRILTTDGNS